MGLHRVLPWVAALALAPLVSSGAEPCECGIRTEVRIGGGPRLGVHVQPMTPELREFFEVEEDAGVLVVSVGEKSPAAEAGLRVGDVIVAINGARVRSPRDLVRQVWRAPSEATVAVEIVRDGERRTLEPNLGHRPEPRAQVWPLHPELFGPGLGPEYVPEIQDALRILKERVRELEQRLDDLEQDLDS
jgi:membrane-associated protease RseP (regulator of RpoE activity)